MSFTSVNGLRFHTEVLGSGPPVAMLHGLLGGNLALWYFTAAPALARSHRVLLYDLRGHGRTELVASGYDLATMAQDLSGLLEDFDTRPVSLIGYSYGALIALHYALQWPERVAKLVLLDAPLPPSKTEEISVFLTRSPLELSEYLPGPVRQSLMNGGRRLFRALKGMEFLYNRTSLKADVLAEPDVPDDALAQLKCDVLCVYGESSPCRPVGERLIRVIPRSKLVLVSGSHYFPLEAPELTTSTLVEFINA
jgi:pimeloyl-ACP methyl ester carboxylesterase